MKILLASQVPPEFELKRQNDEVFPKFQAQAFWLNGLKELGVDVEVFLYTKPVVLPIKINAKLHVFFHRKFPTIYNKYRLAKNRFYYLFLENYLKSFRLNKLIKNSPPDKIIISGGISDLVLFPLITAKKMGIKIILLHGVNPLEGSTGFERDAIKVFDAIITNDPTHAKLWKKIGANRAYALPYAGIDPTVHRKKKIPVEKQKELGADVVFVGTLFPDRQELFKQLLNFDIKIYGNIPPHIKLDPALSKVYCGEAWGQKAVDIYNSSKIVINLVPPHMPVGGNMRTFEIPGCGAFQLTNRCPKEWFIPDKEIVLFLSTNELKRKMQYYLSHNNKLKNISESAYQKTQQQYNYAKRFKQLLSQ